MGRDKLRHDVNETAFRLVQAATGQGERPHPPGEGTPNPEAVKRGRMGGKKGGPARAKALNPKRRKGIARKASKARWAKDQRP
jgi:hypothetical protein